MSRRADGQLFIGRLSKDVRTRDLEDVFELYGRLTRCDIKYGAEMAYAFVDYEDRRDAEDAIKYENGRQIRGSSIVVEWTKGAIRRPGARQESQGYDECYKCHRVGHWARDCPEDRYGRRGSSGGGGGSYRGGGRRRSRSRSPRRRRSKSRSRSRDRRRKRSRSRSRSRSRDNRRRRSPSQSKSRSRSRSPIRQSGSKSPRPERRSISRSRSRSRGSGNENGDDGAD